MGRRRSSKRRRIQPHEDDIIVSCFGQRQRLFGVPDPAITPTPQSTRDSAHVKLFRSEVVAMTRRMYENRSCGYRDILTRRQFDVQEWKSDERRSNELKFAPIQNTPDCQSSSGISESFEWYGSSFEADWLRTVGWEDCWLLVDLSLQSLKKLKALYRKYCSPKTFAFGRAQLIHELVHYYYHGSLLSGSRGRRSMEENVLREMDTENLFFSLLGLTLTKDVMEKIVSYLPRNRELIFGVGLVAWDWYVLVLSSWREVTVTKMNIFQIPRVVLRGVREIEFNQINATSRFTMKEIKYLTGAITPSQVKKLSFVACNSLAFERICIPLTRFAKGTQKIPGPRFSSLDVIEVRLWDCSCSSDKQFRRIQEFRLSDLSPNLRIVNQPAFLAWCSALEHLCELRFILSGFAVSFAGIDLPNLRHLSVNANRCSASVLRDACPWMAGMLTSGQLTSFELRRTHPEFLGLVGKSTPLLKEIEQFVLVSGFGFRGAEAIRLQLPACRNLTLMDFELNSTTLTIQSAMESLNELHVSVRGDETGETLKNLIQFALEKPLSVFDASTHRHGAHQDSVFICPRKRKGFFAPSPVEPVLFQSFFELVPDLAGWKLAFDVTGQPEILVSHPVVADFLQRASVDDSIQIQSSRLPGQHYTDRDVLLVNWNIRSVIHLVETSRPRRGGGFFL